MHILKTFTADYTVLLNSFRCRAIPSSFIALSLSILALTTYTLYYSPHLIPFALQVCVITDRQYTFAQLRDASAAFAVRLQKKFKLAKPDVLAICLPNLPEYPIATLGAIEAGLAVTTINPIYTPGKTFQCRRNSFRSLIGYLMSPLIFMILAQSKDQRLQIRDEGPVFLIEINPFTVLCDSLYGVDKL